MRQERVFFLLLFATVGLLALAILQPFVTYIVLAAILSYTLFPIYRFLLGRVKRPELSSALSIILALIVLVIPTIFLVSDLFQQVSGAYPSFDAASLPRVPN